MWKKSLSGLLLGIFLVVGVLQGTAAAGAIISPGDSVLLETQDIDIAFIINVAVEDILDVAIFFDFVDITGLVMGLPPVFGSSPLGITARLPGINAGDLGIGFHDLEIVVTTPLGDVEDFVTYEVIETTE